MKRVAMLALLAACVSGLPKPPAPVRRANLAIQIQTAELSNGLRVVIVQDPRATDVAVTMRYATGSVDDPPDQAGVAHLVEHLMFQQVLGAQSIFARLQQNATDFNAFTTWDATTYFAQAAPSHLDELLTIDGVRMQFRCTTITDSAFEREREVVANEITERDAAAEAWAAILAGLYSETHPYARSIGGTPQTVRAITHDQACAFADAHYTPGNAVLVISGNLEVPRVEAALGKFLGKVAKRTAVAQAPVPPPAAPHHAELSVPIDDEALVIAWPLPADPLARMRLRALESTVVSAIDASIKGSVAATERGGDVRAPMFVIVAVPAKDESIQDVEKAAHDAIDAAPKSFRGGGYVEYGELAFDRLQQTAIYGLFAGLEGGSHRDIQLATAVLAGQDPNAALADEFAGLREMTRENAASLIHDQLAFDRATVLSLTPKKATKEGHRVEVAAADIHDRGLHRDPPDPALAHQPAKNEAPKLEGVRTRTLPNGLKVVLLPLTSVPAIDIRMVFAAGTADEPVTQRGVALVAAHGLTWDLRYLNDLLVFAAAGGTDEVQVGFDATAFESHGLEMNLDALLAGMRRWVCDGKYTGDTDAIVTIMRNQAKAVDDDGALTDAWRTALYGPNHPYVNAGLVRHVGAGLSADAAAQFRADHFTPDNATLVIAGHFDAALADRWIDYLFSDWKGKAVGRQSARTAPQPISLARVEDTAQVFVRIALPASPEHPAANLIAVQMLEELADDVRQQLGASYGVHAHLEEARLATRFELEGWVDAARASEAVAFIDKRLAALRSDPDAAARAFVSARQRALTQAEAVAASAEGLAASTHHAIELSRAPMFDAGSDVAALRVDDMSATLAELDLARASIAMGGPQQEVERAFAALGRKPTYITVDKVEAPELAPIHREPPEFHPGELEEALTQREPPHLELAVAGGYTYASIDPGDGDGAMAIAEIGTSSAFQAAVIGLHVGVGKLSGLHDVGAGFVHINKPLDALPLELDGMVRTTNAHRLWGGVIAGIHTTHVSVTSDKDVATSEWRTAVGIGLEGGLDLLNVDGNRLGLYAQLESEIPNAQLVTFMVGVGYRR